MRTCSRFRSGPAPVLINVCRAALAYTLCLLPCGQAPKVASWPRVYIEDAFTHDAVEWALAGAARWLADEGCRSVLSEFRDDRDRPLASRLDAYGVDAPTYLTLLLFRDGSGAKACANEMTFAVTTPGGRAVFVCGRRFERVWRESAARAQAMMIHEMLHTLGLGENPPPSHTITERILTLCDTPKKARR